MKEKCVLLTEHKKICQEKAFLSCIPRPPEDAAGKKYETLRFLLTPNVLFLLKITV